VDEKYHEFLSYCRGVYIPTPFLVKIGTHHFSSIGENAKLCIISNLGVKVRVRVKEKVRVYKHKRATMGIGLPGLTLPAAVARGRHRNRLRIRRVR